MMKLTILKNRLLHGWHFMRVLRLFLGLALCYQGFRAFDWLSAVIGAFFLYQALANTGCCSSNSCSVPVSKKEQDAEDIQYEEIKSKDLNSVE